jgi:opacity protein-like surface antigen
MSMFSSRSGLALVLAALCLGGRTADAQSAPVTYLIPGWSVGFGGNPIAGGSLPGFDGSDARGRYNFSNGWFVGGEGGGTGLSMNGINQAGAFGDPRSLSYQGVQFGYNFQNVGRPLSVYAGFDTLKYNPGIGGPFAPFDTTSGTVPGYSAHAGVEFQPTSNVSLSLGFGYTQQSGRIDSDFNSLPGVSPFALRR